MLNKIELQEVLKKYLFSGNIDEIVFIKESIEYDIDAYCVSTTGGYLVIFQADYIGNTKQEREEFLFTLCKKKLHVEPAYGLELVDDLKNNQLIVSEGTMNKFVIIGAALYGNKEFYEKWFKYRDKTIAEIKGHHGDRHFQK